MLLVRQTDLSTIRPESITLTTHEFRYDPGNIGAVLQRLGLFLYLFVGFSYSGKTPPLSISRNELHLVLVDDVWRDRGRRLVLTWDDRDFEIGAMLSDSQRVALYREIEAWRRATSAQE